MGVEKWNIIDTLWWVFLQLQELHESSDLPPRAVMFPSCDKLSKQINKSNKEGKACLLTPCKYDAFAPYFHAHS